MAWGLFSVSLNYEFEYNNEEKDRVQSSLSENRMLARDDLRAVALWKINRALEFTDDVLKSLESLRSVGNLRYDSALSKGVIMKLVSARGIGYPVASAILKFIRPDVFPIIDARAFRVLFQQKAKCSFDAYMDYTRQIHEIACFFDMPLDRVDEQLYCFDKCYNKQIPI